jgi:small subunit ribosomal protein S16
MAVKLRMKRLGNTHRPFYRIVSVDGRKKRDGRVIEELGTFDPREPDETRQAKIKLDRAAYWLSVGAQPSQTVAMLLRRHGMTAQPGTARNDQPADLDAAAAEALAAVGQAQTQRQHEQAARLAARQVEAEAKRKAELEAKEKEQKDQAAQDQAEPGQDNAADVAPDAQAPAGAGTDQPQTDDQPAKDS